MDVEFEIEHIDTLSQVYDLTFTIVLLLWVKTGKLNFVKFEREYLRWGR